MSKYARYVLNLLDHGIIDEKNVFDLIPFIQGIAGDTAELPDAGMTDSDGTELQNQLDSKTRKKYAANYTLTDAAVLLQSFCENTSQTSKIIDPFCGSGRLILAYLTNQVFSVTPEVYINDIMEESALLAYVNIVAIYLKKGWDLKKIFVSSGDAFSKNWDDDFDLVIINPPFTRVHYLNNIQRERMKQLCEASNFTLEGQPGLHIFSLILVNTMLAQGGQMLAILPLSTLTSNYSPSFRKWILSQYSNLKFIYPQNMKSFSEGSSFREVMFSGFKKENSTEDIEFISTFQSMSLWKRKATKIFSIQEALNEWNWSRFFKSKDLWDATMVLESLLPLQTLNQIGAKIIRGLEMYGPDFFFIPNKNVKKIDERYVIGEEVIDIPKEVMLNALRKPGNYRGRITPQITSKVLSIPESMKHSQWLWKYKTKAASLAKAAVKKYGEDYPHHISSQIQSKQPFSQIFFADKFGLSSVSQLCFFSEERITCSKNFYLILGLTKKEMKALAAWVNSTIYLLLFMFNRREIGGSYGRMQISDLKKAIIFVEPRQISTPEVFTAFDKLRFMDLPPLPLQIGKEYRKELDIAILNALGLKGCQELLISIYETISIEFQYLEMRDNSRHES